MPHDDPMRGGPVTVASLLALSVAGALWAERPFRDLPEVVPQEGADAGGAGLAVAAVAVLLLAAAAAALVWAARRDLGRAVRLLTGAAIAYGLLLLLLPALLWVGAPAAGWVTAALVAAALAWWLAAPGWPSWLAAALAAGGLAGMAAGVAGPLVLAIAVVAVAAYDAWAVRRRSMGAASSAAEAMGLPLSVGRAEAGLSLGLGDLLLPAAVVASAVRLGWPAVALSALGLALGFALLAWQVSRRDLPGLPLLGGGALLGLAAGWALGRMS
jgi:presenilin-like A22 family membrane protease